MRPCSSCKNPKSSCKILLKIITNVFSSLLYNYVEHDMNGSFAESTDLGSMLFNVATTIWLTCVNLVPKCLSPWKEPFQFMYDAFAVVIISHLAVRLVWAEIYSFFSLSVDVFCQYEVFCFEDHYDKLGFEMTDFIGGFTLLWVLWSFGFAAPIIEPLFSKICLCRCSHLRDCILQNTRTHINEYDGLLQDSTHHSVIYPKSK